mgnify:CR=1 FL=1
MPRLDMTDALIQIVVQEMSPLVERLTGWSLQLATLRQRVLPKERGYEEILLSRMQAAGVNVEDDSPRNIMERLAEYMLEETVLAAYEPGSGEILVIRENVDDSNLDGLRLVVAHELVHRGQHVNHREIFAQVDQSTRSVCQMALDSDSARVMALEHLQRIQPAMTMLESHAMYVQNTIKRLYLPKAVIESHFNLAVMLMRLLAAPKAAQYTGAVPAVARAARNGTLEDLYRSLQG